MRWLKFFQPAGVDIFCLGKKFLVLNLVSRNLKIKYRRSVLGVFWTLLVPMSVAIVYYFVFKVVLQVSIPHYMVFVLSGVLYWNFFSQSIIEGMESIVGSFGLVTKIPIPLQIFPFVGTLTNLVTLLLAIPVLLGAALFTDTPIGFYSLLLLFYAGLLFIMAYSIGLLLSVSFVFFRDLRHIMGIVMQIWFYTTPVLYNESMVPAHYRWLLYMNPVGNAFSDIHKVAVHGQWPSQLSVCTTIGWTGILLGGSVLMLKFMGKKVVEKI